MKPLAFGLLVLGFAAALAGHAQVSPPLPAATNDLAPLPLKLPIPPLGIGPLMLPSGAHIQRMADRPRPPFLAPRGATNLALHKPVSASTDKLLGGRLEQVCDGQKECDMENRLQLPTGLQWVQIDLGEAYPIFAIVVWHDEYLRVYHDVIAQVADNATFTQNVRTLFNNDYDGSASLGIGADKEYYETYEGLLVNAKGERARFVRCYAGGPHKEPANRIIPTPNNLVTEIEVWGLPQTGTPAE